MWATIKSLVVLATITTATPTRSCHVPVAGPVNTIVDFPDGYWAENLAERSDGTILTTVFTPGQLVLISPRDNRLQNVTTFPDSRIVVSGLVELEPDVFYFATNVRGAGLTDELIGEGRVWRIDMNDFNGTEMSATLISNITTSSLLNGVTLARETNQILIADSKLGVVFRVDPSSGAFDIASNDTALRPITSGNLGVNGIHTKGQDLYFTNWEKGIYGRFGIDKLGTQIGETEVLVNLDSHTIDDFDFLHEESAILADGGSNRVVFASSHHGKDCSTDLAEIQGPTAVKVVRSDHQFWTVYVTSAGLESDYGQSGPIKTGGSLISFRIQAW